MSDLNERWAALLEAGKVRWVPGMRVSSSADVPGGRQFGRLVLDATHIVRDHQPVLAVWYARERGYHVPDLTDPATLGCLLALVREVAQDPGLHVRCMLPYAPDMSGKAPPPWVLYSGRGQRCGDRYDTEAEALVAALEAAP